MHIVSTADTILRIANVSGIRKRLSVIDLWRRRARYLLLHLDAFMQRRYELPKFMSGCCQLKYGILCPLMPHDCSAKIACLVLVITKPLW